MTYLPSFFLVGLGSLFGGITRWGTVEIADILMPTNFPWGILVVNALGGFLVGILAPLVFLFDSQDLRLFWIIGFCGSYTTFSTFSLNTLQLLQQGELIAASLNIASNVGVCLTMTLLGLVLSQWLFVGASQP